ATPTATTEELFLLQRLLRGLGSHNLDHRLRQRDFSDQGAEPLYPGLPPLDALEQVDGVLLLGAYPRHEQPLVNLRLRKAALRGACVVSLDMRARDYNYALTAEHVARPSALLAHAATLLREVAAVRGTPVPAPLDRVVDAHALEDAALAATARRLAGTERLVVITGLGIEQHPLRGVLMQIAEAIATLAGGQHGSMANGGNAAGAWLAGMVPHRGPAGRAIEQPGLALDAMLDASLKGYVLLGLDPALDCAEARRLRDALGRAECVVALSGFTSSALEEVADIMLPTAVYGENEGSFVNLNGLWQSFESAVRPRGEARPAWKILRVLGSRLGLAGFEAVKVGDVTREMSDLAGAASSTGRATPTLDESRLAVGDGGLEVIVDVPMYRSDALVRHAAALQAMPQAGDDDIRVCAATAGALGLADGAAVTLRGHAGTAGARLVVDDSVPEGACVIAGARTALADLAIQGGALELARASGDAAA
ncbi:MAG: molybdopterin-dependent oxidoreductase, partial [Gammaproteobacteria bacterium]